MKVHAIESSSVLTSLLLAGTFALPACSGSEQVIGGAAVVAPSESTLGSLRFVAQDGWIEEEPQSDMRVAQYRLPGGEGEDSDATLVVYRFKGSGGGALANIERWCGQFEQPDGRPSKEVATISVDERDGLIFHRCELSGRYVAETAPGSGEHVNIEDQRMLAAVIETIGEPYYIKLVGPEATVRRWDATYRSFLESIRP